MAVTEGDDVTLVHPAIAATGRMLFALIFFLSAVTHFTNLQQYVALMPAAIPFRTFWVMISAVVEVVGATLIASDRYPPLGGRLVGLFLVPVTIPRPARAVMTAPALPSRAGQTS